MKLICKRRPRADEDNGRKMGLSENKDTSPLRYSERLDGGKLQKLSASNFPFSTRFQRPIDVVINLY